MKTAIGTRQDHSTKKQTEQSSLFTEITDTFFKGFPLTVTVEQWHLDHIEKEWAKGSYSSRKNCDHLLLEIELINRGMRAPTTWRHDIQMKAWKKVDLKHIIGQWFNIKSDNHFQKSIKMGELDSFLFYRSKFNGKPATTNDRIYKLNDQVEFNPIQFKDAQETLNEALTSQYSGQYYIPKDYVLSSESVV